jgi:hemerythrin
LEVDEQHHHLVNLVNHFGELLDSPLEHSEAVISEIINEMIAYSQYHFSEEETMMARVGLDPRHQQEHIAIHADFCRS